ncbi:MAG: hypothetical protein V3V26_02150 [Candidatus Aenigmarchaeota archaeon]
MFDEAAQLKGTEFYFSLNILQGVFDGMQKSWGRETGEILFGHRMDDGVYVVRAVPEPIVAGGEEALCINVSKRREIISWVEESEGLEYVGGWHSHVLHCGSPEPTYPNDFENCLSEGSKGRAYVCGIAKYIHPLFDTNVAFWPWRAMELPESCEVEVEVNTGKKREFNTFVVDHSVRSVNPEELKKWRYIWDYEGIDDGFMLIRDSDPEAYRDQREYRVVQV